MLAFWPGGRGLGRVILCPTREWKIVSATVHGAIAMFICQLFQEHSEGGLRNTKTGILYVTR